MRGLPSFAEEILAAALDAADPRLAVRRHLRAQGRGVWVDDVLYQPSGRVCVLAVGKASGQMLAGACDALGARIDDALVVAKHPIPAGVAELLLGDHPVPGPRSAAAGARVCAFVDSLQPTDLLIVLLSGGGSSLVAAPVDGVSLAELAELSSRLVRAGAPIGQINTVRRHLDVLKGGGLAARCRADIVTLVLSDVLGDALEAVASGPTAPDPTTPADAMTTLRELHLDEPWAVDALRRAPRSRPREVQHVVVANCAQAVAAALRRAAELGFHTVAWGAEIEGEARDVGAMLAEDVRAYQGPAPACFVGGGETTVTVVGDGRGGRNLEVALAAVEPLSGAHDRAVVTFATDGEDGPTDAAGAWVDGESRDRGRRLGLDAAEHLRRSDSYTYFESIGALLRPGPTGTNVNDLVLGFVGERWLIGTAPR